MLQSSHSLACYAPEKFPHESTILRRSHKFHIYTQTSTALRTRIVADARQRHAWLRLLPGLTCCWWRSQDELLINTSYPFSAFSLLSLTLLHFTLFHYLLFSYNPLSLPLLFSLFSLLLSSLFHSILLTSDVLCLTLDLSLLLLSLPSQALSSALTIHPQSTPLTQTSYALHGFLSPELHNYHVTHFSKMPLLD